MKKLELNQMENLEGGKGCGKAGGAMGIAGGILGVVVMATPAGWALTLAGGLAVGFGASFGVAGIGCGLAEFF